MSPSRHSRAPARCRHRKPPDAEADKKALEAKQADEKKAAEAEFEKSWTDFKPKLPEGVTLDEASLKEFTPLAKELGLKPEQAQKLVDLQVKTAAARQASETKARDDGLKTERDGWLKDLKADKDLGGTKWDDTLRVANKAFEKFADPALRQFLQATGLDAHPGLVRSFHKIGLALKDDSIAGSSSTGAGAPSAEAINAQLYPSMQPKS